MNDAWKNSQLESLAAAEHRGETWTTSDLRFLDAFKDEPVAELAAALERTVYGTATMRQKLVERLNRPIKAATLAATARVYTFIGEDVPAGW